MIDYDIQNKCVLLLQKDKTFTIIFCVSIDRFKIYSFEVGLIVCVFPEKSIKNSTLLIKTIIALLRNSNNGGN